MLKQLRISNFTAFGAAIFDFSPGLNVIVGANGTGKTHVLKLGYLFTRAWPDLKRAGRDVIEKRAEAYFEDRLMGLFRPEQLAHLLRHGSTKKAEIAAELSELWLGGRHESPRVRGRIWSGGLNSTGMGTNQLT
ncbi:AAA family ATPase [uncultured Thiodictyon sp.]|jgi:recombinational DNA repair ATPase RecF|uniref:AAA family ATPase n=1 Tax=uncultured Thiodictyon sp. TaxID=1846217 RepID=UPI0025DB3742|nr:AAA family ATPase [uncultured Thiodictyon sp.]